MENEYKSVRLLLMAKGYDDMVTLLEEDGRGHLLDGPYKRNEDCSRGFVLVDDINAKVKVMSESCALVLAGEAVASSNALVQAQGVGKVQAFDRASVYAGDNANVRLWENSKGEIWGFAVAEAMDVARVKASGRSQVVARDRVLVDASQSASVEASHQAEIFAKDSAYVESKDNNKVWVSDNAIVLANDPYNCVDVYASGSSKVRVNGYAKVEAKDDVTIECYGTSNVKATDRVAVRGSENTSVQISGHGTVWADGNCKVASFDDVQVKAQERAAVWSSDNVKVTASDTSEVVAHGNSKVTAMGHSYVELHGDSKCEAINSTVVVCNRRAEDLLEFEGNRQKYGEGRLTVKLNENNGLYEVRFEHPEYGQTKAAAISYKDYAEYRDRGPIVKPELASKYLAKEINALVSAPKTEREQKQEKRIRF